MGWFGGKNRVAELCRQSGKWHLGERNGDVHWLHAREGMGLTLRVKYRPGFAMLFEADLPVRFSLDDPPSGLFARVLLRSVPLVFASWRMDIQESCEAALYLSAQQRDKAVDAWLFDTVCREMRDEVLGFHQELRDKFRYQAGGFMAGGAAAVAPRPGEVRFVGPVMERVEGESRNRLGDGRGSR